MSLNPFTFHAPENLSEAVDLYDKLDKVKITAGGTFLINFLRAAQKAGRKTPEHILSLSRINEIKGVREKAEGLSIGAMTTISELRQSPLLKGYTAVLKSAARQIATTPIRNMATVGGNVTCRYTWTELPSLLIALGADLHFAIKGGKEETHSAESFFNNQAKTDKILTRISIRKEEGLRAVYKRGQKTTAVDIPLLGICLKARIVESRVEDPVVAVNNTVSFAQRDHTLEKFLSGSELSSDLSTEALSHLDDTIYDTRSDEYKQHLFRACLKQAIDELGKPAERETNQT